jgi:serine/threonine protein kinase
MEYMSQGDLKKLIQEHQQNNEPLEEQIILQILSQIILALKH